VQSAVLQLNDTKWRALQEHKMNLHWIAVTMLTAILSLAGCYEHPAAISYPTPTALDWQRLQQMNILFGHQSVGGNIVDGVKILAAQQEIPIAIIESRDIHVHKEFQHFKIGKNGDPQSKMYDFRQVITRQAPQGVDIALMKFCYIDFSKETDPEQLARSYLSLIDELQKSFGNTRLVAVTAPLTTIQTGPKAWIKKILGKMPDGYQENAIRQRFNYLIREESRKNLPIFDLARLESRNGEVHYQLDGKTIEALDPNLSSDGGHLNIEGQKLLGGAFVHYLSTLQLKNQ